MRKMRAGTKLGVRTGVLVFFPNRGAADPEVTGLKTCGTVVRWGGLQKMEAIGFQSRTALQGRSYSMSNYRKQDILQDAKLNDLISPSGLKRNQSCFHHIKCGVTSD